MSSKRQITWKKGAIQLLNNAFLTDLQKFIGDLEGTSQSIEEVLVIAEKLIDVASVFVSGGSDLVNIILKGFSENLRVIVQDMLSIGGHGIYITPFNRKNKRNIFIGISESTVGQTFDVTSERREQKGLQPIKIPYTIGVPAMTAVEALKELREAMFNDSDPMSPRWTENVETRGIILLTNINTPSNLGIFLKILKDLFGEWASVEDAWKGYTSFIENKAQRHLFISENVEKIAGASETLTMEADKAKKQKAVLDSQNDTTNDLIAQYNTDLKAYDAKIKKLREDLSFATSFPESYTYEAFQKDLTQARNGSDRTTLNRLERLNSIGAFTTISSLLLSLQSHIASIEETRASTTKKWAEQGEYSRGIAENIKNLETSTIPLQTTTNKLIIDTLLISPDFQKYITDTSKSLENLIVGQFVGQGPQWFGFSLGSIPFLNEALLTIEKAVTTLVEAIGKTSSFLQDLIEAIKGKIQIIRQLLNAIVNAIKAIELLKNLAEFYVVTIPADFGGRTQLMGDIEKSVAKAVSEIGFNPTMQFSTLLFLGWGGAINTQAWEKMLSETADKADSQVNLITQSVDDLLNNVDDTINFSLPSYQISPYFDDPSSKFLYGSTIDFTVLCPSDSSKRKVYFAYELLDNNNKVISKKINMDKVNNSDSILQRSNKKVKLTLKRQDNDISKISDSDSGSRFNLRVTVFAFHPITRKRISEITNKSIVIIKEPKISKIVIKVRNEAPTIVLLTSEVNKIGGVLDLSCTITPDTPALRKNVSWKSNNPKIEIKNITGLTAQAVFKDPLVEEETVVITCLDKIDPSVQASATLRGTFKRIPSSTGESSTTVPSGEASSPLSTLPDGTPVSIDGITYETPVIIEVVDSSNAVTDTGTNTSTGTGTKQNENGENVAVVNEDSLIQIYNPEKGEWSDPIPVLTKKKWC